MPVYASAAPFTAALVLLLPPTGCPQSPMPPGTPQLGAVRGASSRSSACRRCTSTPAMWPPLGGCKPGVGRRLQAAAAQAPAALAVQAPAAPAVPLAPCSPMHAGGPDTLPPPWAAQCPPQACGKSAPPHTAAAAMAARLHSMEGQGARLVHHGYSVALLATTLAWHESAQGKAVPAQGAFHTSHTHPVGFPTAAQTGTPAPAHPRPWRCALARAGLGRVSSCTGSAQGSMQRIHSQPAPPSRGGSH